MLQEEGEPDGDDEDVGEVEEDGEEDEEPGVGDHGVDEDDELCFVFVLEDGFDLLVFLAVEVHEVLQEDEVLFGDDEAGVGSSGGGDLLPQIEEFVAREDDGETQEDQRDIGEQQDEGEEDTEHDSVSRVAPLHNLPEIVLNLNQQIQPVNKVIVQPSHPHNLQLRLRVHLRKLINMLLQFPRYLPGLNPAPLLPIRYCQPIIKCPCYPSVNSELQFLVLCYGEVTISFSKSIFLSTR